MRAHHALLTTAALLLLLLTTQSASANPVEDIATVHAEAEHAVGPNIAGTKAHALVLVEQAHTTAGGGLSLFYERAFLDHHLAWELSIGFLCHDDVALLPAELLLKLPFHVGSAWFEPYIGLGAVLDILVAPTTRLEPGVTTVAGTYLWLGEHLGLDVEVAYTVVFDGTHPVHELTPAIGGIFHF